MVGGTRDRYVNTSGGSGGGGDVTLVALDPSINPLPVDDAAAQALLTAIITALGGVIDVDIQNASVTVDDGGGSITVDGTVDIGNFPASTEISNDVGNPVPVTGTVAVTQPVQVVGPAADGVAVSGNPVRIAGKDAGGLTQDALADSSGNLGAVLKSSTVAMGDGASNSPVQPINEASTAPVASATYPRMYNGSTWDRVRGDTTNGMDVDVTRVGGNVTVVDGGGSLTVDGTVTADTELPAAAALADGVSNPTAPAVGAFVLAWNGSTWDRVRVDAPGALRTQINSSTPGASSDPADSLSRTIGLGSGTLGDYSLPLMYNGSSLVRLRGDATNGLDVDVTRLPAFINGVIKDNSGDDCTVAHAGDLLDAAETVQIVAASGSKKIRVLDYELSQVAAAAGTFTWMSSGVQVAGTTRQLFDTGFSQPFRHAVAAPGAFLFETAAGANLQINSNAASMRLDVRISYIYVD